MKSKISVFSGLGTGSIKHSKFTDFAIRQPAEKQSFMAFRKAHDSPSI